MLTVEACNYSKVRDFYSYYADRESTIFSQKLTRVKERILQRYPLTIRSGNWKDFDNEVKILHEIYNDAFAEHWGFVPIPLDEFEHFAQSLKQTIDPELVLIAEYDGDPIGFLITIPNFNEILAKIPTGRLFPFGWLRMLIMKDRIKGARIFNLGVKQQYIPLGIGSLFYREIFLRLHARGFTHGEMAWVVEDNLLMNRITRMVGGRIHKKYRIYGKELNDGK